MVVKQPSGVAQVLVDLLEDTADALASISEFLIGLGPKPAQLIELLGRVLTQLRQAYTGQWDLAHVQHPAALPPCECARRRHCVGG